MSLLSGFLGALIVFLFTVAYTEVKEARQRVRTRMGYARLLEVEVEANIKALQAMHERAVHKRTIAPLGHRRLWPEETPTDNVWKKVSEPLAPLIASDDLKRLVEHYQILNLFFDFQDDSMRAKFDERQDHQSMVDAVAEDVTETIFDVQEIVRKYANPSRRKQHLGF